MSDPVATVPKDLPREKREGRSPRARAKSPPPAQPAASEADRLAELRKAEPHAGAHVDRTV